MTDNAEGDIKKEDDHIINHICLKCRRFISTCKTGQVLLNVNEHKIQSMELKEHIRIKKS